MIVVFYDAPNLERGRPLACASADVFVRLCRSGWTETRTLRQHAAFCKFLRVFRPRVHELSVTRDTPATHCLAAYRNLTSPPMLFCNHKSHSVHSMLAFGYFNGQFAYKPTATQRLLFLYFQTLAIILT